MGNEVFVLLRPRKMKAILMITFFILCFLIYTCNGRKTYTFAWQAPTEPSNSTEDEEGQLQTSPKNLIWYACTTAREVLDLQSQFLVGVIQQFHKIQQKQKVRWAHNFEMVLLNCQSIIDHDQDEIKERILGRKEPPDYTTNPLRPPSVTNLIHNFNHLILIIEEDETLKGADEEIQAIRRILDNAECELHRFNFRIRKVMKRVARRVSTMSTKIRNCTASTPITAPTAST